MTEKERSIQGTRDRIEAMETVRIGSGFYTTEAVLAAYDAMGLKAVMIKTGMDSPDPVYQLLATILFTELGLLDES